MVIDMVIIVTHNRDMKIINVNEAKAYFSSYLAKVAEGETIVICKRNQPVAEIRPIKMAIKKKRPIGLAKKEYPALTVDDNFFAPLPDELVAAFNSERP